MPREEPKSPADVYLQLRQEIHRLAARNHNLAAENAALKERVEQLEQADADNQALLHASTAEK